MIDLLAFYIWYFLWIFAVIGIGVSAYKLLDFENITNYPSFEYGIIGITIITIIVGFVNFFLGFSIIFSLILLLWGLIGYVNFCLMKGVSSNFVKPNIILGSVIFIFILAWFHPVHDTGGYHLSAIKWIISQHIPFGLANLYSRLGFNTTWFLGGACIEQLIFIFNRPLFILNGVLLFLYSNIIFSIFKQSCISQRNTGLRENIQNMFRILTARDIYFILSIFPVILISGYFISTASPDFPVFILILMIFGLSFQLAEEDSKGIKKYHQLLFLTFLCFYLFSLKTSSIPIFFFLIGLIFINLCSDKYSFNENYHKLRPFVLTRITFFYSLIITLLITIFIIRGIYLSGNPLFPVYLQFFIDLPWNVPKDLTIETMNEVIIPARLYTSNDMSLLENMKWVLPWSITFAKKNITLLVIWVTTLGSLLTYYLEERQNFFQKLTGNTIQKPFTLFCLIIALLFWFFSAPDPRFGYGFLYALPLFLIVYPIIGKKEPNKKWFVILIIRICYVYIIMIGLLLISMLIIWGINIPFMPETSYSVEYSGNGEIIYFSHSWDHIWNMPLPNTPENIYSKIIIEKLPENNKYRMFSFPNITSNLES